MKNCIFLLSVCLLILFAGATSLAQTVFAPPAPQAETERPRNSQQTCPTISVSCLIPTNVGEPLVFKASIGGGDTNVTATYNWEVFGGVVTEGQWTSAIRVKVGPAGQAVTATLHVGGLDTNCAKTASCTMPVHQLRPLTKKFDSYGGFPIKKEKARLDVFAAALKQHPGAQGYILSYSGRRSRAGEVQKALDRAKKYLVNKCGIDEGRIVTVNGGFKEQLTIDLWLVPAGGIPPTAEPTVDPTEAKLIKTTENKTAQRPIKH